MGSGEMFARQHHDFFTRGIMDKAIGETIESLRNLEEPSIRRGTNTNGPIEQLEASRSSKADISGFESP